MDVTATRAEQLSSAACGSARAHLLRKVPFSAS